MIRLDISDNKNLTINSGTGDITLVNIHGDGTNSTSTTTLDIDGATITVKEIGNSAVKDEIGSITIDGTTKVQLNGAIYTGGASNTVTITGATELATGTILIDTTDGNGAVTLDGTVDGARDLDIISGTGLAKITGNIGTSTALLSLDMNAVDTAGDTGGVTLEGNIGVGTTSGTTPGVGIVNLGNTATTTAITLSGVSYNTSGAVTLDSAGGYSISGTTSNGTTIVTSGDAVTFGTSTSTADVTVGEKPFAIDTDTTASSGGAITFYGDIIGATASGTGNTAADVTLDAYDATVTLEGIGANGTTEVNEINDISVTGGTIVLDGIYNATGVTGDAAGITFTGAVQLAGDVTVDSDVTGTTIDGNISFSSTVDDDGAGGTTSNLVVKSGAGTLGITGDL